MNFKIMTKQYFIELADYNIWANNIQCDWLEQISEEQWKQHIVSSFNSIQDTVLHIIAAENIWLQRLEKQEQTIWLQGSYTGTKAEHIALWKSLSQKLKDFTIDMDESVLKENLEFKRLNGDAYSMPHYQVLAHIFNHSTYHRGQLITMLRQAGFTKVGSTDMLGYFRK
jgi:uncharacterized damage-inducible protein DinB